jgi:hypothetical protein
LCWRSARVTRLLTWQTELLLGILVGTVGAFRIALERQGVCERLFIARAAPGAKVRCHGALCAREFAWLANIAWSPVVAWRALLEAPILVKIVANHASLMVQAAAGAVI